MFGLLQVCTFALATQVILVGDVNCDVCTDLLVGDLHIFGALSICVSTISSGMAHYTNRHGSVCSIETKKKERGSISVSCIPGNVNNTVALLSTKYVHYTSHSYKCLCQCCGAVVCVLLLYSRLKCK